MRETVARGDTILFVGTKKQAQEPISEEATRAEMPYVNQRWLGGMLTNFVTIRKRLGLLDQLEARQQNGEFERLTKKEASRLTDEMTRLQRTLGGMRKMRRLPGAMFVIDPQREHIAVIEARKLEIPVIGTGDTNVDPDLLDYVIPANDDAIRAIRLLCTAGRRRGRSRARRSAPRARSRSPSRRSRSRKRQATRWSRRSPPAARSASSPSPTRKSSCRPRAPSRRGPKKRRSERPAGRRTLPVRAHSAPNRDAQTDRQRTDEESTD